MDDTQIWCDASEGHHQNPKLSSREFESGSSNTVGGGCVPALALGELLASSWNTGESGISATTRLLLRLSNLRGSGASSMKPTESRLGVVLTVGRERRNSHSRTRFRASRSQPIRS